jgi:hypothetical protein
MIRGSNPGMDKEFFYSLNLGDQHWVTARLKFDGCWSPFPGEKREGCENDHSTSFIVPYSREFS